MGDQLKVKLTNLKCAKPNNLGQFFINKLRGAFVGRGYYIWTLAVTFLTSKLKYDADGS
jgi:hypothetical protein